MLTSSFETKFAKFAAHSEARRLSKSPLIWSYTKRWFLDGALTARTSKDMIQWSINIAASLGFITSNVFTWSSMLEITRSRTLFPRVSKQLSWSKKWSLRISTKRCSQVLVEDSEEYQEILGRVMSLQISILSNLLQDSSRKLRRRWHLKKSANDSLRDVLIQWM